MLASLVARDCCAWPVLTRWPDGTLGLVHFDCATHGRTEGNLAALVSHDAGATWAGAGLAAPHEPASNRMHLATGLDHAGRWLVLSTGFHFVGEEWAGLTPLWLSVAAAPGQPWTVHRQISIAVPSPALIPHGRIAALPDGRLAATFYLSEGRERPSRAWLAFSRDDGQTWGEAVELGEGDANEVVFLPRPNADWLAVVRTHRDYHLKLLRSPDAGATWPAPADLTLPMQHPGDLTELGDGRILLTYGIRNRGLMALGARLSRDGGANWGAPAVIFQFGEALDCGYPSTVVCADGGLLTAAYSDCSPLHQGYHLLTVRWSLDEFFGPRKASGV
ncbi:MAG: exo-alpha-sialidase [Opitutaceae bacterium]|nr:exo-alpha-sialidase [Opitutaceae bacterium]